MSSRRKNFPKDKYTRDLEGFIAQYIAATGDQSWTLLKVAEWAINNGKWERRRVSAIRQLARELSNIAGKVKIFDEDTGREIRKYHAFRLGEHQPMLWAEMDTITPEQMNESKTMRRNKLAAGAIQLVFDLDYYNRKYNPGDPIEVDGDFTPDIEEASQPSLYDDKPPEDDGEPPAPPKG